MTKTIKKHKHAKTHKKVHSQKLVILFFLSLVVFACIVLFKNSKESVLGSTVGSPGTVTQQGTQEQPTSAPLPTAQPTFKLPVQPTTEQITQPTIQPTSAPLVQPTTVQLPQVTPTPTLVVPQEPIYVPVIDPLKQDPPTVNLADDATTVVIEQTAGGLVTTTEQLTPKNEPIPQSETIITSQTGQAVTGSTTPATNVTTEPSVIDKFIALLSGQAPEPTPVQQSLTTDTVPEQAKTESQPVLYQQVYVSDASAPTYVTDSTETVAVLDKWLGLNDTKLTSSSTGTFTIAQEDIKTVITPKDSKMAINLYRMEPLMNTEYGFMPLSYSAKKATVYAQDLNIISHVTGDVKVIVTPTELVYDVAGTSDQYFLALWKLPLPKQLKISAKTGEIREVKQSLISKTFDMLSL